MLKRLAKRCTRAAQRLRDEEAVRECARILSSQLDPSVVEYAASTLVAHLLHRLGGGDQNASFLSL